MPQREVCAVRSFLHRGYRPRRTDDLPEYQVWLGAILIAGFLILIYVLGIGLGFKEYP